MSHVHHPLYRRWKQIRQRCYNKRSKAYPDYGGRGIKLCSRWYRSFQKFAKDIERDIGLPKSGYTLDRIDNNKGYEPGNIRWATRAEQNKHRRSRIEISFKGKTQSLSDWARELKLPLLTLYSRIKRDRWTIKRALTTPSGPQGNKRAFL